MNISTARIGYARVSTEDQNPDAQIAALEAAGCTMIRTETRDGATLTGRPELGVILDFIRPGETLVVPRIDRMVRSMHDLQVIVATLKDKGAPSPRARGRRNRRGEAAWRLSRSSAADRHGSHRAPACQGPVADGGRPRAGDLTGNCLQGRGGHESQRMTKSA